VMINEEAIKEAMQTGLVFVCATCEFYHKGIEKGLNRCLAHECQGSKDGFSKYEGILKGRMANFCYVCGGLPSYIVDIKGRLFGICKQHLSVYLKVSPSQQENSENISDAQS
jgi:hypothetical protein